MKKDNKKSWEIKISKEVQVSVVLPCRNEEAAVGACVSKIKEVFKREGIAGEIIVSDSSTDKSPEIAESLGARVVRHGKEGYGNACLEGLAQAQGEYIVIADADGTYDFNDIPRFLARLKEGADLVVGNRFEGEIKENAMPSLHRYLGNPFLSGMLKLFFKINISDAHCGFRAIKKEALKKLDLKTTGMEFASEMIIKAKRAGLNISEIPIVYHPRIGESKMSSFKDGWRHLRFMLLYSPEYLFLVPGIFIFLAGLFLLLLLLQGPASLFGVILLDIHPMILGSLLAIVGYQVILLGVYAKTYAIVNRLDEDKGIISAINNKVNVEKGILIGGFVFLIGFILHLNILIGWMNGGFGYLSQIRIAIFALTFTVIGIQTVFSAFFLSVLSIKHKY